MYFLIRCIGSAGVPSKWKKSGKNSFSFALSHDHLIFQLVDRYGLSVVMELFLIHRFFQPVITFSKLHAEDSLHHSPWQLPFYIFSSFRVQPKNAQVRTVVDNVFAEGCVLKTVFRYYSLVWKQYPTKDLLNLYGYFGIKTTCVFITLKMGSSFRIVNLDFCV